MRATKLLAAIGAIGAFAAPALAGEGTCSGGLCAIEASLDRAAAPSAREVQSAVDSYLSTAKPDASLVGGPGSAGYDGGFWIRGGTFLLKTNLTIQTRFEYFDWDDRNEEPSPGGDLSGFSLPRLTLKLSGDATCDMHYYAELEFGHSGTLADNQRSAESISTEFRLLGSGRKFGILQSPEALRALDNGIAREAWIEYEASPATIVRMGLIKTAATRQLMTAPEMQQFVDISMASAAVGNVMPGYSDRNRDYGIMVHGAFGCDGEWSYMLTATNGDGPVHRNVIDGFTSDNLAYSARVNYDFMGHMGYEEGALRQKDCEWAGAVGAWAHYYSDHLFENPIVRLGDRLTWGVDAALGYGGWSMTAAYSAFSLDNSALGGDIDASSYLVQVGYLFPDTAWEVAARYSAYTADFGGDIGATEVGVAVNYYVDGHSNKLTWDAAFISPEDNGNFLADVYAGYSSTGDSDALLLRFQWQLAL